ncbi:MAG: 30S ribosomal protein S9 [Planctomycetaceae bacterium]
MASEPEQNVDETNTGTEAEGTRTLSLEESLDIGSQSGGDTEKSVGTIRGKIDKFGVAMGTGRRKTSVARIRLKDGNGKFIVNGRELNEYFPSIRDQVAAKGPLKATDMLGKVDVQVKVVAVV